MLNECNEFSKLGEGYLQEYMDCHGAKAPYNDEKSSLQGRELEKGVNICAKHPVKNLVAQNQTSPQPSPTLGEEAMNVPSLKKGRLGWVNFFLRSTDKYSSRFTPHSSHKCSAFTLAEVLITLGIIGVVASVTLSVLIQNYQKQVAVSQLKRSYSTFLHAIELSENENGNINGWYNWDDAEFILEKYILPYLDYAKMYPKSADGSLRRVMCYEKNSYYSGLNQYIWFNKQHMSSPLSEYAASVRLKDGSCIGLNPTIGIYKKYILIDVNGSFKKPNIMGKDLFVFLITDDGKIKPVGYNWAVDELTASDKNQACNKKAKSGGLVCSAKIMFDGWKMNYPW